MKNKDIILEAIKIAKANGWTLMQRVRVTPIETEGDLYKLIFNHDFAKALWGEELYEDESWFHEYPEPKYKAMLAYMAVADDPIQYLGKYLRNNAQT